MDPRRGGSAAESLGRRVTDPEGQGRPRHGGGGVGRPGVGRPAQRVSLGAVSRTSSSGCQWAPLGLTGASCASPSCRSQVNQSWEPLEVLPASRWELQEPPRRPTCQRQSSFRVHQLHFAQASTAGGSFDFVFWPGAGQGLGHTWKHSELTPGTVFRVAPGGWAWGTTSGARDRMLVGCMQSKCITHCTISLAPKCLLFKILVYFLEDSLW